MNMIWCWHQFCGESNFLMSSTKSHRALLSDTCVLGSSQQTQALQLLSMRIISCESCYNTSRVKYYSITIPKWFHIVFWICNSQMTLMYIYIDNLSSMCQTFPPRGTGAFTKDPPTYFYGSHHWRVHHLPLHLFTDWWHWTLRRFHSPRSGWNQRKANKETKETVHPSQFQLLMNQLPFLVFFGNGHSYWSSENLEPRRLSLEKTA